MLSDLEPEVRFQELICAFRLPISLRVIRRGYVLFDVQCFTKSFCKFRREPCIPIGYDFSRNSISWIDLADIERSYSFCHDGLLAGDKDGCFATVMIRDCEDGVVFA